MRYFHDLSEIPCQPRREEKNTPFSQSVSLEENKKSVRRIKAVIRLVKCELSSGEDAVVVKRVGIRKARSCRMTAISCMDAKEMEGGAEHCGSRFPISAGGGEAKVGWFGARLGEECAPAAVHQRSPAVPLPSRLLSSFAVRWRRRN